MFSMLQDHVTKGYNFVVVTGNPRVGALGGCKDALDHVLNRFDAVGQTCAGFVFSPCTTVHLEGPSFRYATHTGILIGIISVRWLGM